jgi:DNA adenine methylase
MKYMGSKSRIAKYIVPIIQKYIDDNNVTKYVEPFVGGANVIDKIQCKERYGFDKNKYLIALLKRVQSEKPLHESVGRELYSNVRSEYKLPSCQFEDWEVGNVGFLASYNGRWFDGGYAQSGYEKTKTGERFRDYYQEAKNNLLTQSINFKDIVFNECDYLDAVELPYDCDSVIYCDPPYAGTKQYANATSFDNVKFWGTMREWSKHNIVLISEQNAPDDFKCIWEQEVSRSIKATDKSKSVEKLFIHKTI